MPPRHAAAAAPALRPIEPARQPGERFDRGGATNLLRPFRSLRMTRRHLLALLSAIGLGPRAASAQGPSPAAPKVEPLHLADAEWRKRLTPEQYAVLRHEGTERPFTSPLNQEKRKGTLPLRRLRPAAVLVGDQVRERHRLAELLRRPARRDRHQDRPTS